MRHSFIYYMIFWKFRFYFVRSPLDNIPGPPSASLWTGNHSQLFDRHGWDFQRDIGQNCGGVVKLAGLFGRRHLYVFDPLALYHILIKDQQSFEHPTFFLTRNQIVFGQSLLSTTGEHHRKQRKMLNPVFSIKHMRDMMPIFYEVTNRLQRALVSQTSSGTKELDILDWMSRTALELVGKAGFAYSFDPLVEDVPNEFGDALKSLLPTIHELGTLRRLIHLFLQLDSPRFRRHLVEWFPSRRLHKLRYIVDLMEKQSQNIVSASKQMLERADGESSNNDDTRKDIISILLKANMEADEEDKLPDDEVVGQITYVPFNTNLTMTFLGGSRACIGFKFSQLEMKVVLSMLIKNFTFALTDADIVWNIVGVKYPTVGKLDGRAQLPMRVTQVAKT